MKKCIEYFILTEPIIIKNIKTRCQGYRKVHIYNGSFRNKIN